MPIYAYRCDECGAAKDVLQKISDAPLTVCPQCGASAFRKVLTAPAFQLKGSGWYVTDFRDGNKAKPDPAKSSEPAVADAASGSAAKGDSPASADGKPAGGEKPAASKSADAKTADAKTASAAPASTSGTPQGGSAT